MSRVGRPASTPRIERALARRPLSVCAPDGPIARAPGSAEAFVAELESYPSEAMRRFTRLLALLARDPSSPVLLVGASGVGKRRSAEAIHALSRRSQGPFEVVDLGAVNRELAASALFGHFPGAFTGATDEHVGGFLAANTGTLFLDEIGKCDMGVQAHLLNAIEYGEFRILGSERNVIVDTRVVAATNVELGDLVLQGRFLPDLRARLSPFTLRVPALRDRRADIPLLARAAIARAATAFGLPTPPGISDELLAAICEYEWPDNVRELSGTIRRIVLHGLGAPVLTLRHVAADLDFAAASRRRRPRRSRDAIRSALAACDGNVSRAAERLGCHRSSIYRHLARDKSRSRDATADATADATTEGAIDGRAIM